MWVGRTCNDFEVKSLGRGEERTFEVNYFHPIVLGCVHIFIGQINSKCLSSVVIWQVGEVFKSYGGDP